MDTGGGSVLQLWVQVKLGSWKILVCKEARDRRKNLPARIGQTFRITIIKRFKKEDEVDGLQE